MALKQTGVDLDQCSGAELSQSIQDLQADRSKLYKAWDQSLRAYCRSRRRCETTSNPTNHADQAQCLADYYHLTTDLIGAFAAASVEVKRHATAYEKRNSMEATHLVRALQLLEKEKLQLTVRRHGVLREGVVEDDTSERLCELVEELRDVVGELRCLMVEAEVEP